MMRLLLWNETGRLLGRIRLLYISMCHELKCAVNRRLSGYLASPEYGQDEVHGRPKHIISNLPGNQNPSTYIPWVDASIPTVEGVGSCEFAKVNSGNTQSTNPCT
jgi:hypothetical protein